MDLAAEHQASLARKAHAASVALGDVLDAIGYERSRPEGYEIPDLDDIRFQLQKWALQLAHDDPVLLTEVLTPTRPGVDNPTIDL